MIILNFHGLGRKTRAMPDGESHCWLETGFFGEILDRVKGRANVQISLDDANESDFTIALPMLKERGLQAKFFVVAERLDQPNFLSRAQLKTLCAEGMTVANHGMRHVAWKNLDADGLREELLDAKKTIEQVTGIPVTEAACPFGTYGRTALGSLRKYGYARVYTSDGGSTNPDAWIQSRNTVVRSDTLASVEALLNSTPSGMRHWLRKCKQLVKRWR